MVHGGEEKEFDPVEYPELRILSILYKDGTMRHTSQIKRLFWWFRIGSIWTCEFNASAFNYHKGTNLFKWKYPTRSHCAVIITKYKKFYRSLQSDVIHSTEITNY